MNNNELNNQEIIIKDKDISKLEEICKKEKYTKEEMENELLLLIFCKMCYEDERELSIKRGDIERYAPKLEELFSKLGLPCNQFVKTPVSETYDQLKTHIIVTVLMNNYGYPNTDYNVLNLNVNRQNVIYNLKQYKKIENIIDMGYRIITDKPFVIEEPTIENNTKELSTLVENIDMINLVSSPNELENITFRQYFELFIEYQDYLKQRLKEILYFEFLDGKYDNIEITKFLSDKKSTILNIRFEGKTSKYVVFEKEKINDTFKYIWDKSRIIRRERTVDDLFEFTESNQSYFGNNSSIIYPTKDRSLSVLIHPQNIDNYKTLAITYEYANDIISIKSNYLDGQMKYEVYINGITIHILNEDIEPILDNLYINIDILPQYMQDFIEIKERKSKRKKRKVKLKDLGE